MFLFRDTIFVLLFLVLANFLKFFFPIVNQQVNLHKDLKTKFIEGAKERKELYNKVLELKG